MPRIRRQPLVCEHLEDISRDMLEEFQDVIKDFVRGRHGVYALYRKSRLYYVGLARNLRNRLKQHLKDRHGESWDRFSVYLTIGDSHIRELEALVLRIVQPKGNRHKGRFMKSRDIKRAIRQQMITRHRERLLDLLGQKRSARITKHKTRRRTSVNGRVPTLAEYITRPMRLRGHYRGKVVRARVRTTGAIRFNGKTYNSPSESAGAACQRRWRDGWRFWEYERAPGDWVPLRELRR